MTTVVRINSKDDIVLVSDSQGTSDCDGMKDLNSSKLLSINQSIGIGVASVVGHIRVSVDEKIGFKVLGAKLEDDTFALCRLRFPPWVDPIEGY
jgi:hypothetical protein